MSELEKVISEVDSFLDEARKENYAAIKWAAFESPPEEKIKRVWTGIHKGVSFEINWFRFGPTDTEDRWTHYIYIPIDDQVPDEAIREKLWLKDELVNEFGTQRIRHDYYSLSDIEFHGGITWYSKESGTVPGEPRVVKIGCDYQHLWDRNQHYTMPSVYSEVKETIDSFIKFCGGKIKVRSSGDGKYRFIEEYEKQ